MKSKTSFFNRTIFQKNASLYWPLWVSFTALIIGIPGIGLWVTYYQQRKYADTESLLYCFENGMNLDFPTFLILVYAVLYAMAFFSYLYSPRTTNMIHSLPVTRRELFGTNYLSGLIFLIVPEIFAFLFCVLLSLSYGMTQVQHVGEWFLYVAVISILFYSMATFCAMLTGQLIALPVLYLALHFFYPALKLLADLAIEYFGIGISLSDRWKMGNGYVLCPLVFIRRKVQFEGVYETIKTPYGDTFNRLKGLNFTNPHVLFLYLIPAVILVLAAYFFYEKRSLESASDLLSVQFLKPVFRWGLGIVFGMLGSILVVGVMTAFGITVPRVLLFFVYLFVGILFFLVGEMFIIKNFNVFYKKRMIEAGVFVCALVVLYGAVWGVALHIERSIPKSQDVDYAVVTWGYSATFDDEDVQKVIDFQSTLIENDDKLRNINYREEDISSVGIIYYMKNGEHIRRSYDIPTNDKNLNEALKVLGESLNEPFRYLKFALGIMDRDKCYMEGGSIEKIDDDMCYEQDIEFSAKTAEAIFDAMLKDVQTGAFQKYNGYYWNESSQNYVTYLEYITINYEMTVPDTVNMDNYYESGTIASYSVEGRDEKNHTITYRNNLYFAFGSDCTNIIQALIDEGLISSTDDLHSYDYENIDEEEFD